MTLPERVNAIERRAHQDHADVLFCVEALRVTVGALISITDHEGEAGAKHEQVAWAALEDVTRLAETAPLPAR